jgi:hypothetical protein
LISDKERGGKQKKRSIFLDFIRAAAAPILGTSDPLLDQAKEAIQKYHELEKDRADRAAKRLAANPPRTRTRQKRRA